MPDESSSDDEVKVYRDEGWKGDESQSAEDETLSDVKNSLVSEEVEYGDSFLAQKYGTRPLENYLNLHSNGTTLPLWHHCLKRASMMMCRAANIGTSRSRYCPISPTQQKRSSGHRKRDDHHIKKPLNAFMLFMREQRPKMAAQFALRESAAINQKLGQKWHELSRAEQIKYYDLARVERDMHRQRYPGWTARDNYAAKGKKKKRKTHKDEGSLNSPKKCRARFGMDQQQRWCKPCRRKKRCEATEPKRENV